MASKTYEEYLEIAKSVNTLVKSTLSIGAGNKILNQPTGPEWFVLRYACVKYVERADTQKQLTDLDNKLAKEMVEYAEKTWGRDNNGNWKASKTIIGQYVKYKILNATADIIEVNAVAAKKYKCGNCEEFCSLTFKYLKDRGVTPIDWMAEAGYFGGDFGNHAFVIIARDKATDPEDISTWNSEVVWCDPYEDVVGGIKEIKERFTRKIRLLYRWEI